MFAGGLYFPGSIKGSNPILQPWYIPNTFHPAELLIKKKLQLSHFILIGLILANLLVYGPATGFDFVSYDDGQHVYENSHVQDFSFSNLVFFWKQPYQNLYIPLTYNLWSLLAKLSDIFPGESDQALNPHIFHMANVLLHLLSTLVMFLLLKRLTNYDWGSAAGALLFALHPVQAETVAWISELKGALCGFLSLTALWQYILFSKSNPDKKKLHYGLATGAFLLALLSKPPAVVVPLIAGIIGYFLLEKSIRKTVLEMIPWILMVLPLVLITKLSQDDSQIGFLPALWQRFLIAGDAMSFYVAKLVFPANLRIDYGRIPEYVLQDSSIFMTGIIPIILLAAILWKFRNPWLLAALGIFIVSLAPVLGLFSFMHQNISTVADRYLYLAMLGPALGLAFLFQKIEQKRAMIILAALLLIYGYSSAVQVRTWQDSSTLYTHTLQGNPGSWTAQNNLGMEYFNAGNNVSAVKHLSRAMGVSKNDYNTARSMTNLGMIYGKALQDYETAIRYLSEATALNPVLKEAYINLSTAQSLAGKDSLAAVTLEKAVEMIPTDPEVYTELALAYSRLGKMEKSVEFFQKAAHIKNVAAR